MMTTQKRPTWESTFDAKRFFKDIQMPSGETETRMIRVTTAAVIVSIPLRSGSVEKVAFMKSNRGKQYRDSRGRKVSSKRSEFGDGTETHLAPAYLSADECKAELVRLLDDSWEADKAFRALNA